MLFSKEKKTNKMKTILGTFQDSKGMAYELVKEKQKRWLDKVEGWEEIILYRGKEKFQPWDVCRLDLDLSKSSVEANQNLVFEFLKTSSNITSCLQYFDFPIENLKKIWKERLKLNGFVNETILACQPIANDSAFIQTLSHEHQWIFLTQNQYRTNENMKPYNEMFKTVVVTFLTTYLSKENVEKYEQIEGEWKTLILETFKNYYPEEKIEDVIAVALQQATKERLAVEQQLRDLRNEIKRLDGAYEKALLSKKYKIEEKVKESLEMEREILHKVEESKDKIERITMYFSVE